MQVLIEPSTRAASKWMARVGAKTIHFGARGYEDYTQHGDAARKQRYLRRHAERENWNDWTTAGFWSRWLLWNERTLTKSARDISKKFGLQIYFIL